eukprot:jgi/Orpsp1_1/1188821/evm.model.d7180000067435.1
MNNNKKLNNEKLSNKKRIRDDDSISSDKEDKSDEEPLINRKIRILNKKKNKKHKILNIITKDPISYEEAMNSKDSKLWKSSMDKELNNMYRCRVMKILDTIPKYMKALDLRWVYTTKDDDSKKARLVAKGCQQKKGKDFMKTYSPTVQADSLRLTVGIASIYHWNLRQLDIKAAYLNADLDKKIYTKIPRGDKNHNKGKYWLLKKALYGLKQAGRMWYKEITKFLKNIGYKQYQNDRCLFGKYNKNKKLIGLLTLYVDDILITGTDEIIQDTINKLKQKYSISKDTEAKKII